MARNNYLSARPVSTPFGLYDCDVPCDGAIAVEDAQTKNELRDPPAVGGPVPR